jgi:DNA-binding MarR family transcriptional regulator
MTRSNDADRIGATLGRLLLRSHRAHLYAALTGSQADVDETTYPVLSGLARLQSATATELAEQIGLDRTVTTRYATRLEQAGLLTRSHHPDDARATVLTLTDAGRRTIAVMRQQLSSLIHDATSDWSAAQTRDFANAFEVLVHNLAPPTAE